MYANLTSRRRFARLLLVAYSVASLLMAGPTGVVAQQPNFAPQNSDFAMPQANVEFKVTQATERLEMTVNTSQILSVGTRIPRIVVNNPDLVTATPISETQIQIAARKPGVTQVNLWDEKGNIYTVDLLIFGDVRELEVNLRRMFPSSSLRVIRLTNSLVLEGQVDRPEIVSTIRALAEDYAPKVVNNITVGGAQQVVLKVKIMEVSRTKLRDAGFDFAQISSGGFLTSGAAGILGSDGQIGTRAGSADIHFGVVDGNDSFFGFLQLLQQNDLVKTLADPTLVTVSGRPASFVSGGEIFFQINNGISGSTVESEEFGTQVDFLPIVLGNGRIRLEVRPKISDIDSSTPIGNELFRTKLSQVDTGVEMMAGQTLALAGLIQTKVRAQSRGVPYLKDIPVLGFPFRSTNEDVEEVELLIMVTPEFGEAMDPHEVPQCGPGMETMSPTTAQLMCKGQIEVPACGPCGASEPCYCNAPGLACQAQGMGACGPGGCNQPYGGPAYGGPVYNGAAMATDAGMHAMHAPAEAYEGQAYQGQMYSQPMPAQPQVIHGPAMQPTPAPIQQAPATSQPRVQPPPQQLRPATGPAVPDPSAGLQRPQWQNASAVAPASPVSRHNPHPVQHTAGRATSTPGLIGPIGYDVQK